MIVVMDSEVSSALQGFKLTHRKISFCSNFVENDSLIWEVKQKGLRSGQIILEVKNAMDES